jgi:hypothetical protein
MKKLHERAIWWLDMKDKANERRIYAELESTRKYDFFGVKEHYMRKASQMVDVTIYCHKRYLIVLQQIKTYEK